MIAGIVKARAESGEGLKAGSKRRRTQNLRLQNRYSVHKLCISPRGVSIRF